MSDNFNKLTEPTELTEPTKLTKQASLDNLNQNLIEGITENFNALFCQNDSQQSFNFEQICDILHPLVEKISVSKDKTSSEFSKGKKSFGKFLSYNYKLLESCTSIKPDMLKLFDFKSSENWNMFHLIIVSYLSYLKQINLLPDVNLRGMIDKLMLKIEEFDNNNEISDESEEISSNNLIDNIKSNIKNFDKYCNVNPNAFLANVKQHLPETGKSHIILEVLSDIKEMLKSNTSNDASNIIDISRNLSTKYQTLIENGSINMNDLLSGAFELLNDPDKMKKQFSDLDGLSLPDMGSLLSAVSNDPTLKDVINMMGGLNNLENFDINNLGSLLSSMSGETDQNVPQTTADLNIAIDKMMQEIMEAEAEDKAEDEAKNQS